MKLRLASTVGVVLVALCNVHWHLVVAIHVSLSPTTISNHNISPQPIHFYFLFFYFSNLFHILSHLLSFKLFEWRYFNFLVYDYILNPLWLVVWVPEGTYVSVRVHVTMSLNGLKLFGLFFKRERRNKIGALFMIKEICIYTI